MLQNFIKKVGVMMKLLKLFLSFLDFVNFLVKIRIKLPSFLLLPKREKKGQLILIVLCSCKTRTLNKNRDKIEIWEKRFWEEYAGRVKEWTTKVKKGIMEKYEQKNIVNIIRTCKESMYVWGTSKKEKRNT